MENRAMISGHAVKRVINLEKTMGGGNAQGFLQSLRAVGSSLRTNTMRTRPAVTRAAQIQSSR